MLILAVLGRPVCLAAQIDTSSSGSTPSTTIRWWHGAAVLGGVSALMLLDHSSHNFFQDNRSHSSNEIASGLRHFGQPEVYGTVTLGLISAGLISGNDDITRAGGRLAATLVLAGVASTGFKWAAGRPRPNESSDVDGFVPFSGQDAMPSGHTTVAFALATALADDIHRTWATVGLYTIATGVGWSRLNDNKHWLSDVAMGAAVGLTSAKLINGHWRIFNLRPPSILLGPQRAGLAWQFSF
ncbi:MAG TPA: phosphatase PAP2 family protein [Gemmatimonadales bacterium]|nr:phosphatase PAP2 family protein [Gemmatimonadales bacterium]